MEMFRCAQFCLLFWYRPFLPFLFIGLVINSIEISKKFLFRTHFPSDDDDRHCVHSNWENVIYREREEGKVDKDGSHNEASFYDVYIQIDLSLSPFFCFIFLTRGRIISAIREIHCHRCCRYRLCVAVHYFSHLLNLIIRTKRTYYPNRQ